MLCILLPFKTVQRIDLWEQTPRIFWEQAPRISFLMIYYKLYIRGYSPIFPNLITKESYNWWVTKRVWGFRHKISKAKYPKISQNVGGTCRKASGEHRDTVQNIRETLRVDAIRCWICPSGEVETPPDGMCRMWDIRVEWRWSIFPDVRHPGGMVAEQISGCKTSGWNIGAVLYPDVRLIRAQLVYQLIHVQLVLLDWGSNQQNLQPITP